MAKSRARAAEEVPVAGPAAPVAPAVPAVPDRPSGPRSSKGVRTRERLVEAAREIFEEQGFTEARISDIAERAGQSHGSFYYYFDSKEEVFREVAAAVDDQLFAPLDDVIMAKSWLAPQQRIREAMRRHLESYRQHARIMALIEQVSRHDAEVNALRVARHKRHTDEVTKSIRQMQRRKIADTNLDAAIVAVAFGALTHRFAEIWLVQGAVDCSLEHAVEQLSRLFENALRLKAPARKS
jgi:AcrR family transcriptional regulator